LKENKGFVKELVKFMDEMLDRNDVYFVTMLQVGPGSKLLLTQILA
jgi:hypothetical protein